MNEENLVTEVYKGIPIYSRCNDAAEIKQMRAFVNEIVARGLLPWVGKLEYDSMADVCFITPKESPEEQIRKIAEQHISQFEWQGVIGHQGGQSEDVFNY